MSSRLLAIDTAGKTVRLATLEDGKCIAEVRPAAGHHVRGITKHIREMILELEWGLDSIHGMGVNVGPGTFTGIRVGLAVAKSICYVRRIPLIAVDMFDCFDQTMPENATALYVLLEGQMQSCLIGCYERQKNVIRRTSIRSVPQAGLPQHLPADALVTGMLDKLQKLLPPTMRILHAAPWEESRPNIYDLVWQRFTANQFVDPMTIEPFYVRPSSAEEKWDGKSTPHQ